MSDNPPDEPEPQGERPAEATPYSAPKPPSPRIGDAERDAAIGNLREHLSQGRLDTSEFDDRMGKALEAKTSDDLIPLFFDLPEPRPGPSTRAPTAMSYEAPPWQRPSPPTDPVPHQFSDPVPHQFSTAVEPTQAGMNPGLATLASLSWPITILAITFWLGWADFWWLVFLPILVSSALGKDRSNRRRNRDRS